MLGKLVDAVDCAIGCELGGEYLESNKKLAAGASLNCIRISALRSSRLFPAFIIMGTPAQRALLICKDIAAQVGVLESLFVIISSSV